MTASFGDLPERLAEIAEVAGLEAALELAGQFGGSRVSIPAYPKPESWIVDCVGMKAATAICSHFRTFDADDKAVPTQFVLPRGPASLMRQAKRRLAKDLQTGQLSVRDAARRSGLHERTAWRMKGKMRGNPNGDQGDLF